MVTRRAAGLEFSRTTRTVCSSLSTGPPRGSWIGSYIPSAASLTTITQPLTSLAHRVSVAFDFDHDGDVDGIDLNAFAIDPGCVSLETLAENFGKISPPNN